MLEKDGKIKNDEEIKEYEDTTAVRSFLPGNQTCGP